MLRVLTRSICSLIFFLTTSAAIYAQTPSLPTIYVTARTSDGFTVKIPLISTSPGTGILCRFDCGKDEFVYRGTKEQACRELNSNKPANCSMSTFPASPGIPSASGAQWAGNGCGAAPWSTAFASGLLAERWPSYYSGDMNKPIKGNPSIDFTAICNQHDKDYTSRLPKGLADKNFGDRLNDFCGSSTNPTICQLFAGDYVKAVSDFGDSAYAADQAQLVCSAWGDAMRASQCQAGG